MPWFEETLHQDWRQRLPMREVLYRKRTEHQDLVIFETPLFGRVLALDGVVQTTETDEFIYHEMITHVPIVAHGAASEVLIIGGGDGGSLEEVLKHDGVRRAVLVELDANVVELSREFLPSINKGAFDDPRARLVLADGARYVAETEERFDIVVVDSTDPIGPGAVLFSEAFYGGCKRCLKPGGVLVTQGGNPFTDHGRQMRHAHRGLARHFADASCYSVAIPSYIGGVMAFGWACDDPAKRRLTAEQLAQRPLPAGLRHYGPAVHAAAFALPGWMAASLEAG